MLIIAELAISVYHGQCFIQVVIDWIYDIFGHFLLW